MAEITAHITGTIFKIEKQTGDTVAEGDEVIILESMKMEIPLESPIAGVVKQICVAEGEGNSDIGGATFAWRRGDVLAIPSWRPFSHRVADGATLFEMSDEPVMRALGWLRVSD